MEPGIAKLTQAVKRDCKKGQGCFNPNGCDHEFYRKVPVTNPGLIKMGFTTETIRVSKCFHKYCDKYKWVLDRASEYAEALGVSRDDVLNAWERVRFSNYFNYYKEINQPSLNGPQKVLKVEDWKKELVSRFGENTDNWKFVCPACGHIQTPADFKAIGKDEQLAYTDCIGRYTDTADKKACTYTIRGMLKFDHTVVISKYFTPCKVFNIADK